MRERLARVALLAYPRDVRRARGREMIDTLLDASADSDARFTRELAGFVRGGVSARAHEPTRSGVARVSADGLCLAAAWFVTLFLTAGVGMRIRGPLVGFSWSPLSPWALALGRRCARARARGLRQTRGRRGSGIPCNVVAGSARYDLTNRDRIPLLVPLLCFSALLVGPRRRPRDVRRLLADPGRPRCSGGRDD